MKHLFVLILIAAMAVGCDAAEEEIVEPIDLDDRIQRFEVYSEEPAETEEAEEAEEELAEDMEPGETRHFGAEFTIEGEPVDLAEVLAAAAEDEEYAGDEPVKVAAQVHQVCKNKGCWFTLSTDAVDIPVRVRMLDYGFFVSRNTDGADVIVEGTLARTTISEDMAQHYADDVAAAEGVEPEVVEGEQDTFEFTATGISMTLPEA